MPCRDLLARCWDVPDLGTQIDLGRMVFLQEGSDDLSPGI
jgi:hypothetical protein